MATGQWDAAAAEAKRLAALGIELLDEAEHPLFFAQCIEVARNLRDARLGRVGLWPADDKVGIPPLAVHVGLALATVSSTTVAFVDANLRWPATRALEQQRELMGEDDARDPYRTLWLGEMFALVIPREVGRAGESLAALAAALRAGRDLFGHMLVDLTGFERIGDHLNVVELLDGVALVATARKVAERRLLEMEQQLPVDKRAGAILLSA